MSEITVNNTDWSILSDVKAALSAATVGGSAVFGAVTAATCEAQADECQFTRHPVAIVRYTATRQRRTPEGHLACALSVDLVLAARVDAPGTDESARLQEILRLIGAAKNAIAADPPSDSCAWGAAGYSVGRLSFEPPTIEASAAAPWVVARLPLTVGYVLEADTAH